MPLNVEFQSHDMYDIQFMYRCIFPREFQKETEKKNYTDVLNSLTHKPSPISMSNSLLESIILGGNDQENVDLIARPYMKDGKRVVMDHCCEFQEPTNGEFLIELVPKYNSIHTKNMPNSVYSFRHNHNHAIFRYTLPKRYEFDPESRTVTIYLSYNPDEAASADKPAERPEPVLRVA